jgi:putative ABC transport system permease protein
VILKYVPLLRANLQRKPLRTTLTLASIVIAFLLFGILEAMRFALTGVAQIAGQDRLITINKTSIIQSLPASYENRIRSVAGVSVTCSHNWFGGVYQEDRNQLGTYAVEAATFFDAYPELQIPEAQKKAWRSDRTGALVGRDVATRFGWQVGQTIPIRSNIYTRQDGSRVWEMKITAVYDIRNGDNSGIYFHYDYFNEGLNSMYGKDRIGWVVLRIAQPERSDQIAAAIDAQFANSSTETKTTTEKAFVQGFVNQMGNIGAIISVVVTAVFFTMLLVTANAMAQSVRERTNEIAVMKTLGFSSAGITLLILAESLLITALGGGIGLLLANALIGAVPEAVKAYFPVVMIPAQSMLAAAVMMAALGAISAALPCYQAGRLKIVDALRKA